MSKNLPIDTTVLLLPPAVETCRFCHGHGQYVQWWCDAPRMTGACEVCKGAQFLYIGTSKPIPESVRQQVANMNGLVEAPRATDCLVRLKGYTLLRRPEFADKFPYVERKDLIYHWEGNQLEEGDRR